MVKKVHLNLTEENPQEINKNSHFIQYIKTLLKQ